jgi:predicted transcriptional regulator
LEKALQHGCFSISPDLAKQWIGLEQLEKDMELELMDIFPREKELRRLSVTVLQLLNEKKAIPQNDLAEEVFDGNKVKCSRVLDKLEAWGYILREWESTEEARRKIVKFREVC